MFPFYLSIGMTYEQYWEGEPRLTEHYRKANYLVIERKNQEMWLQGLYFYNALTSVASMIFAKKGAKKEKYIDKPPNIFPKTQQELDREAEKERDKAIAMLTAWSKSWAAKHP